MNELMSMLESFITTGRRKGRKEGRKEKDRKKGIRSALIISTSLGKLICEIHCSSIPTHVCDKKQNSFESIIIIVIIHRIFVIFF